MTACLWEASARKAGNVHPSRDFSDLTYRDLVLSAAAIASPLDQAADQPVGSTVLQAIQATRALQATNSNLGIVLVLVPLAAVPQSVDLRSGVQTVLANLTVADARDVYAAIRLAMPGGMGEVPEQDVAHDPTLPLGQIMALAQERDLIARQYGNGYKDVFDGAADLEKALTRFGNLEDAIVHTHLSLMARHPDSLIARKRGQAEAVEAGRRALEVVKAGWPETAEGRRRFDALDAWLTAVGHQRNPGTSADLVTACLFVALHENRMKVPLPIPWARPGS